MNRTIEAIPTTYKDVQFRSRLEARWAVFFDQVKIAWEYEPQKLALKWGGKYIPDFWLPHSLEYFAEKGWGLWLEVKPTMDQVEESIVQLIDVCKATKHNGLLCIGEPIPGRYEFWKFKVGNEIDRPDYGELWFTQKGLTFQGGRHSSLYSLCNGYRFSSYPCFYYDPYDAYGIAMGYQFEEPTE
jgi:hypothetical protein